MQMLYLLVRMSDCTFTRVRGKLFNFLYIVIYSTVLEFFVLWLWCYCHEDTLIVYIIQFLIMARGSSEAPRDNGSDHAMDTKH